MRIVQIVGRADCDVIYALAPPAQLVNMAVEALEFREEMRRGEIAVDDTDRILWIERHSEVAPHRLDRMHVTRRNVACSPDKRELRHASLRLILIFAPRLLGTDRTRRDATISLP